MKPTSGMNPITEDDIANFLANTPDFFERHAQLLASVQMTSPHGNRAVSLQERQAEMLRDKIKALEQRIMEMVRHSSENGATSERLHRWSLNLLRTPQAADLPECVVAQMREQFHVPQAAIKVWDVAPAFADGAFAQGVSDDAKVLASPDATRFDSGMGTEFLERIASLASAALLRLR